MTNRADHYLLAGGPPQRHMKIKNNILIFLLVASISFIGCSSIKVGSSNENTTFYNSTHYHEAHKDGFGDATIKNCKKDTSPNISGKYTSKECDGGRYGQSYPFIALETAPLFFGDSNFGVLSWIQLYKENERRLFNFPNVNFPNDNGTSILKSKLTTVALPIYYLWGDKELGANGNWSFRLGLSLSYHYYHQAELSHDGNTYTASSPHYTDTGTFIAFDWSWFHFSQYVSFNGDKLKFKELKSSKGSPQIVRVLNAESKVAFTYYF